MIDDVADVGVDWGGGDSVLLSCGCWYYSSYFLLECYIATSEKPLLTPEPMTRECCRNCSSSTGSVRR